MLLTTLARTHCATHSLARWSLPLLKTYLCALESLRRAFGLLTAEVDAGSFVPAYVIFLRPDALLACELPVTTILHLQRNEVLVPNHRWFEGINDQMAAAPLAAARHWALRGAELLSYPQFRDNRRIVAEKTVVWAFQAHGLTARDPAGHTRPLSRTGARVYVCTRRRAHTRHKHT